MQLAKNFKQQYGPWALIAGASEGIGEPFATLLAEQGINLVLLSRRQSVLDQCATRLGERFPIEIKTLAIDLTDKDLLSTLEPHIDGLEIGLLIYNAGATHGADYFLDQPVESALNLVGLNCTGPLLLSHRLGSLMRARQRGGILFLSSMIALAGGSYVAAYSATKSFDLIFAQSTDH